MSEMKDEDEAVEHGSSPDSSGTEHGDESPRTEELENRSGNLGDFGNSGDSMTPDEGHKSLESAEEAHLNGDVGVFNSPRKADFDQGVSSPDYVRKDGNPVVDVGDGNGNSIKGSSDLPLILTEVPCRTNEGELEAKRDEVMVESKDVEESKNEEESGKAEEVKKGEELGNMEELNKDVITIAESPALRVNGVKEAVPFKADSTMVPYSFHIEVANHSFPSILHMTAGDEGTEEEQAAFAKELELFFRERGTEFKHPKFYGEGLNCLKLWRAVIRLGGYDRVTSCKLWRQVGESFHPPKTCTTVSWSFRIFYEKALLDYERQKIRGGELAIPASPLPEPMSVENHLGGHQGSGRARRDAAARAMQGWHSQRLLGNGEVSDLTIRDKHSLSTPKREKQLKNIGMPGLLKRKKTPGFDRSVKAARTITKVSKPQIDTVVDDVGPAADWVKISVRRTKDCFEVYALVPGLLREEVRVQSDPAGRLVISGDPEQPDNPWGVTPFKKVITLPSRIDPHQTSAVVTLHGQLFVRVPFEQSDI